MGGLTRCTGTWEGLGVGYVWVAGSKGRKKVGFRDLIDVLIDGNTLARTGKKEQVIVEKGTYAVGKGY